MTADGDLPGVVPSPNIWRTPATYEIENQGVDPDDVIWTAMAAHRGWGGRTVLDVGCGSGFHLPRLASTAARVVGVEPHAPLVDLARRRVASLPPAVRDRVEVRRGTAQSLPLPDASVDVVQARWAYFFGPGCEPGLAELSRVVRRGGTAFVVDVDATRSTFGSWFSRALPTYDAVAVQRFWARQGWSREPLTVRWRLPSREAFESVVRIELAPDHAERALAEQPGCEVDYAVNLWWRDL